MKRCWVGCDCIGMSPCSSAQFHEGTDVTDRSSSSECGYYYAGGNRRWRNNDESRRLLTLFDDDAVESNAFDKCQASDVNYRPSRSRITAAMANQIPLTLSDVSKSIVGPAKKVFEDLPNPMSRLMNSNKNGGARFDGTNTVELDEVNGVAAGASDETWSNPNTNPVLKFVDTTPFNRISKRWQLALMANFGFLIVFGIRCNFGAAKGSMIYEHLDSDGIDRLPEFNWTRAELGVMESSFFYGYLVTQVPAGFLSAKFPANKMFGIAIGGTAMLNVLLPWAFRTHSDAVVIIVQVLQGLIQGFGYPAMHGVWRHWAPPMERSKLATTAFTGSYAGAVFGMPLSAFLVYYLSWSMPFYVYGVMGFVWSIMWFSMTFEKPCLHPSITREEKEYIEAKIGHVSQSHPTLATVPWKAIMTSKPVYAIIVANFARSWTFYLLLQNQLTYMKEALGMKITDSGLLAALPHAVMGMMVLLGGQMADYLRANKILSTTAVRKLFNCGGFGGEAVFMLVVAYTTSQATAILALILAVGCSGFAISGFNVNHLDIAPRYAAILMGFSNGIGTLAGLTCPFVTEKLTATGPNGWVTVFVLASMIHFTGVTFYFWFASGELQDWAEPKDEEFSAVPPGGQPPVNYGAAGTFQDTSATTSEPSYQQSSVPRDIAPQPYQQSTADNPFTAVWNESYQ
uniref:MFS domain-containing protein n=1 Tax=Panagrellus redivivus TaxID=6233 RepID=A0A7E4ZS40_PANRE